MAIADPIGRAGAVTTALQAARLMARLEHEVSEDLSASEEWHGSADRAIDELRGRFPTARSLDAYMQPPTSSPAARAGIRGRETIGHPRRAELGAIALLAVAAVVIWRLVRRLPAHRTVAMIAAGVLFGWRVAAAGVFASAMLVPLQRMRRALHII